jgi:hypothetical protein
MEPIRSRVPSWLALMLNYNPTNNEKINYHIFHPYKHCFTERM